MVLVIALKVCFLVKRGFQTSGVSGGEFSKYLSLAHLWDVRGSGNGGEGRARIKSYVIFILQKYFLTNF